MAVPYTFGSATSAIPLSQLDSNFATTITLGNTAIQLGNTVTTLNNMTLANVTVQTGNVTIGQANAVVYTNGSNVATANASLIAFDGNNLGLGVTPSAWGGSGFKALQVKQFSFRTDTSNNGFITNNAYYDGSVYRYINNSSAQEFSAYNGAFIWAIAPSGTASNVASFTQVLAVEKGKSLALEGATSQTGTGITFPPTSFAHSSSNANTLDDYEEGTWTPNVGGNAAYSSQTGYYIKVGRLVTAWFDFTIGTIGTGATAYIYGLPFTAGGSNGQAGSVSYWTSISQSAVIVTVRVDTGSATIFIGGNTAASNTVDPTFNIFQNGSRLIGTVTYYANA